MATAASLNATSTVIGNHGLAVNANVLAVINTFQSKPTFTLLTNIYANANTYGNVAIVIVPILDTLGGNATQAHLLLDLYPGNITPVASIPPISSSGVAHRFGNLASVSGTIKNQAQGPFNNGMAGFANVLITAQGYASSVFDTVASIFMLRNKTYGKSGLKYNGITDLVTGGIGENAALLGNVISGWGTMYNITNINLISDPYVFGQNLLDQNFGSYGNLEAKLAATGLDTTDITKIPATTTTVTQVTSTLSTQTIVGPVELPTMANVVTTNTVTGNSPDVVVNIYKTITGSNLSAIISGTAFTTNPKIQTLADLLDFNKAVDSTLLPKLNSIGIRNFTEFTAYLNSRVGQSTFTDWSKLANFLTTVSVPVLPYTTTTANTSVLLPSTITTLLNLTGTGTGPFNNPVMLDYLGAVSGTPYTTHFSIINKDYDSLVPPVYTALQGVNSAVSQVNAGFLASAPGDEANCVVQSSDVDSLISAVAVVDATMNSIPSSVLQSSQTSYYRMLNSLTTEVSNLGKAGVIFTSASNSLLLSFGQRMGSLGSPDPSDLGTDLVMANLITNDAYGDTIKAVITETKNISTLGQAGINMSNDPNPRQALSQSKAQNIPLTTYLSQNK